MKIHTMGENVRLLESVKCTLMNNFVVACFTLNFLKRRCHVIIVCTRGLTENLCRKFIRELLYMDRDFSVVSSV